MGCFQGSCNLRLGLVENPRTIDEKEYHSDNSHNSNQKTIIIKEIKEIKDKEIIENIIKETDWSRLKTEKLHGLHDHSHYDLLKKFKSELNDNTHPIDLNQLKLDLNISNNFIKKFPNKDPDNPNSIHSLKQNSINKDQKKENQTVKVI